MPYSFLREKDTLKGPHLSLWEVGRYGARYGYNKPLHQKANDNAWHREKYYPTHGYTWNTGTAPVITGYPTTLLNALPGVSLCRIGL